VAEGSVRSEDGGDGDRGSGSSLVDTIYARLVDEEDARACRDISEEACRQVPGNFLLLVVSQLFTKLGDALANPKTVLAWLLTALAAPTAFAAFLVPIRESGSMVPQLVIASYVRRRPVRKWVFVLGSALQAGAVAAMAVVALTLRGAAAGVALLGALVLFSLARGLCSIASKDVLGKTVPKGRRGRLGGWSAAAAGLVTLGVGVTLMLGVGGAGDRGTFVVLLGAAAGLWLAAAGTYALVREFPGATEGGKNAIAEAARGLGRLRTDAPFRRFVIARGLLLCSALSAPFFILLAHDRAAGAVLVLGLFIVADGLANLLSAPLWGRFADISSRKVMAAAGATAALAGIALVSVVQLSPGAAGAAWLYPIFYFVLAIAHAGVRLGRKTYVVDLAGERDRTVYVSVSNSVIGVILLLAGGIGALAPLIGIPGVILVLATMGLGGSILSARLPDVT
jgi:hypothetical protein